MRILLTGATGFLGSKILKRLVQQKEQVAVLKRSTSDTKRIKDCLEQCSLYDIDKVTLESIFEKEHPEVIIHCAAAYGRSGKETAQVAETNLLFGIQLLSLAEQYQCSHFINTGTFAFKQIEPEGKIDKPIYMADYTLSKYQFVRWGEAFAVRGNLCFITMDLEHIFGEDDDEGKFILMLEQKFISGEPSIDLSDGMQLRDYIYTDNVVDAYMCVLEHHRELEGFQQFQVGMGEPIALKDFVIMMKEVSESNISLEFGKRPRNDNEPACSVADISGLEQLGWKPGISRKEGIREMLRRDREAGRI
ncbi:MAG: NAD(P)-dependent oxidoreductase [Lachnospiraceae bacterium]|nr:NAD(P)-dependent oxidoreductase [Lachnospiraceae bacterium]